MAKIMLECELAPVDKPSVPKKNGGYTKHVKSLFEHGSIFGGEPIGQQDAEGRQIMGKISLWVSLENGTSRAVTKRGVLVATKSA